MSFTLFGSQAIELVFGFTYSMKLYDGYNQSSQEIDTSHTSFYNSPTTPATNVHTFVLNCWKEFVLEIIFLVCVQLRDCKGIS